MARNCRRLLVAMTVVCAVVLSAGAGSATARPSDSDVASASAFMKKIIAFKAVGQAGRAYDYLVPAQKGIVSKPAYIACQTNGGVTLDSVELKDAYAETVQVPGTNQTAKTIALTFTVTASVGAAKQSTTVTVHAVRAKKGWAWGLTRADLEKCSNSSTTSSGAATA